jgi:hypothetical protein
MHFCYFFSGEKQVLFSKAFLLTKMQWFWFSEILFLLLHFPLKPIWLNTDRLFNGRKVCRLFREFRAFVTTKVNPLYRELVLANLIIPLYRGCSYSLHCFGSRL